MSIALGELIDQLLDSGCRQGDHFFSSSLTQRYLSSKAAFQHLLELCCNRWRFAFRAFRVAALPGLELELPWRAARANPVPALRTVLIFGFGCAGGFWPHFSVPL